VDIHELRARKVQQRIGEYQARLAEEVQFHKELIQEQLNSLEEFPTHKFQSQGIVTLAGGDRYFPGGYVLCRHLRHLGCQLPIQVWFLGREEMTLQMQLLLEAIPKVSCVDARDVLGDRPRRLGGWEAKVWAIMECPFQEVLFLDSDQIPLADPSPLFSHQKYLDTGAVLWQDFPSSGGWDVGPEAFTACGLEVPPGEIFHDPRHRRYKVRGGYIPVESGQILVDKSRQWAPLQLCRHLNDHSDFWYRHIYGDKSTFLLSWLRTNSPYAVPAAPTWFGTQLGGGFLQPDLDGNPLFQHRCQPTTKLRLEGNRFSSDFVGAEQVRSYLQELSVLWKKNPPVPPDSWRMRRAPMELGIWQDIMCSNDYRLPNQFPPNSTVLDIGGHVGIFAKACLTRGARVVSVEPHPQNFADLCANLSDNGNWEAYPVAAWDRNGPLWFRSGSHTGEGSVHSDSGELRCWGVPLADLIDLCGGSVFLLKLDCEASEWVLLRQDLSQVQHVCGEYHLHHTPFVLEDLSPLLSAQGFSGIEVLPNPRDPKVGLFFAHRA
jgi:FkbM family methyltransferase